MDMEGVPERAIVMKRLSVDEYIHNLTMLLLKLRVRDSAMGGYYHRHQSCRNVSWQKS